MNMIMILFGNMSQINSTTITSEGKVYIAHCTAPGPCGLEHWIGDLHIMPEKQLDSILPRFAHRWNPRWTKVETWVAPVHSAIPGQSARSHPISRVCIPSLGWQVALLRVHTLDLQDAHWTSLVFEELNDRQLNKWTKHGIASWKDRVMSLDVSVLGEMEEETPSCSRGHPAPIKGGALHPQHP